MGIEKKVYSVRLDEELLTELKIISNEENRSLSNLVETVLKRYVHSKKDALAREDKTN